MTRTQPWDGQDLEPCPFCGGEAEDYTRLNTGATADFCGTASHWIGCTGDCGASTCMHEEMRFARDAWNTRVNKGPAADAMAVALEGAADALHVAADKLNAAGFDMESADLLDAEHDARSNLAAYRESVS